MDKSDSTGLDPIQDENFEKNTTTMVVTYAAEAMKTAAKYVSHGERNVITPEDIKRAMMLEMFLFNKRSNLIETAAEIKREIYDGEELDDEEIEDLIVEENEADEFKENE